MSKAAQPQDSAAVNRIRATLPAVDHIADGVARLYSFELLRSSPKMQKTLKKLARKLNYAVAGVRSEEQASAASR